MAGMVVLAILHPGLKQFGSADNSVEEPPVAS
jgi:hypothetical protein